MPARGLVLPSQSSRRIHRPKIGWRSINQVELKRQAVVYGLESKAKIAEGVGYERKSEIAVGVWDKFWCIGCGGDLAAGAIVDMSVKTKRGRVGFRFVGFASRKRMAVSPTI